MPSRPGEPGRGLPGLGTRVLGQFCNGLRHLAAAASCLSGTPASRVQADPSSRSTGSRQQKLKLQAPLAAV